jgi:hypothetical protein
MLINQAEVKSENVETEKELLEVENQYWVSLHEALERLEKNEDFKAVVLDGYFKDKAINGVSLLANDYVKSNGLRSDVMEQLVAVSALQDYFKVIHNLGSTPQEDDEE